MGCLRLSYYQNQFKSSLTFEKSDFSSYSGYVYRFNGMEVDNEVKGSGNSYTTEFRQYDPRLGRWLTLDPLMAKYPWASPYNAFNDNPMRFTDREGLEGNDWIKKLVQINGNGIQKLTQKKRQIKSMEQEQIIKHQEAHILLLVEEQYS